jgi:hypothetical protein
MTQDVTRFPGGISDKGQARAAGRASVTGTATIATGLDTVEGGTATLEELSATAGHGFAVSAKASATPGSIDVAVAQIGGTAATVAVEVSWTAYGAA